MTYLARKIVEALAFLIVLAFFVWWASALGFEGGMAFLVGLTMMYFLGGLTLVLVGSYLEKNDK